MKIEITIPQTIVDKLRSFNLKDNEIVEVYQEYLLYLLHPAGYPDSDFSDLNQFLFWLEKQEDLLEQYEK